MKLLIYGVTGYTGALISRMAAQAGVDHIAAGRTQARVDRHAGACGVEARAFGLDSPAQLDQALADVGVVLNTAGPFARTAGPLVEACLRTGTHYLDLAGEVPEFEAVRAFDSRARERGIMLMPGVGFGVVPTDAVAAKLAAGLPDATRLRIAFEAVGGVSRGTLGTLFHDIGRTGVRRRNGALVPARPAEEVRRIDLGDGGRIAVTNPWRADLVTAYWSTGIDTIDTYTVFPGPVRWLMRASRVTGWLMSRRLVQSLLSALLRRLPAGPDEQALSSGSTRIWAEVENADGARTTMRVRGPEAYVFTARTALDVAGRVLGGAAPAGFQTPVMAYGPDLLDRIDGVEVLDVQHAA